jgi:hypothetical protein
MSIKSLYAVMVVATMACASAGTAGARTHREPNVITQDEIAASNEATAYDAIARLRPLFLKTRGRTTINAQTDEYATVFLDGQRYGNLSSLRSIVASQILEARYLPAAEAVGKYGMQYGSGVIDIKTR